MTPDPSPPPRPGILAWSLRITALAAGLAVLAILAVRLPPFNPPEFISSYGSADNRRALLLYAALVAAILAGPLVVRGWLRERIPRPGWVPALLDAGSGGLRSRRTLITLLLGALVTGFFVGPWIAIHPLNGHELVHLGYLNELAQGGQLNVDTRVTYGPLLGYTIYAFMKLTTFTIFGFRLYWSVVTALTLIGLCAGLYRRLRFRFLIAVFLGYAVLHTAARHHLSGADGLPIGTWGWANPLRHGWLPLTLLMLWKPVTRGHARWPLVLLGAIGALGGAYYQDTGVPGMLTLVAVVLLARPGRGVPRLVLDSGFLLLGFAGAALLVGLPALLAGSFLEFADATWRAPDLFLRGAGNLPYPSLPWPGDPAFLHALPYYLIPALLLVALALTWATVIWGRRTYLLEFFLLFYATASFASVLVRGDTMHLLNIGLAPLLVGTLLADKALERTLVGASRPRILKGVALVGILAPLLLIPPGARVLGNAVMGRIIHPFPHPPSGWEKLPFARGGIWTPAESWFDDAAMGPKDNPEAVAMVRRLTGSEKTFIDGNRASLYYFLGGVPCAVPYTDLSSQCQTPRDRRILNEAFLHRPPSYAFTMQSVEAADQPPPRGYRRLGSEYGLTVYQRLDLIPVELALERPASGP